MLKDHERKSVDCRIKIIDFGSAKRLVPGHTVSAIEGTPEFMAPEVINFDEITVNTGEMTEQIVDNILKQINGLLGSSPMFSSLATLHFWVMMTT